MVWPSVEAVGGRVCGLLLLWLVLAVPAGPVFGQGPALDFEPGIFEVRVGRGISTTVATLVAADGQVLLPLLPVLDRVGLSVERDPASGSVSIPTPGSSHPTVLDPAARHIRCGPETMALAERAVLVRGDQVYLTPEALAEYLRAEVSIDWPMLLVTLHRTPPFPAEQQISAAGRRSALVEPRAGTGEPSRGAAALAASSGGLALDWGVSTPIAVAPRDVSIRLQLGTALYGGELVAGATVQRAAGGAGESPVTASYRRVFPESPLLRQLQLGDLVAAASLARPLRGIGVSNAPLIPEALFAEVPVDPSLPPGWEYEIYQDGQLLGFSTGTEGSPVRVPLRYGSTPLQVRMLSPSGEEIVSDLLYQVPTFQVAPGRLQYAAATGACPRAACELFAFGDLRYGATRWLTLHGGSEVMRDSSGTEARPYGSVFASGLSGWYTTVQAARGAYWRSQLGYAGMAALTGVVGGGMEYATALQPTVLAGTGKRWHANGMLTLRARGLPWGARSLRLDGRAEGRAPGPMSAPDAAPTRPQWWTAGVGVDFHRASVAMHLERPLDRLRDQVRLSSTVVLPSAAPGLLADRALSASVRGDGRGINQAEAMTSLQYRRAHFLGLSVRWQERSGPAVQLSYNAVLGWSRVAARGGSARAGASGTLQWTGGMYFQGPMEPVGSPESAVSAAGVEGRVFLDRDGDGVFGEGDEPVAGVPISVAGRRTTAGADGWYQVWNVVPYELMQVSLDTLRLGNPHWMPARSRVLLRPVPHQLSRVDLPLLLTREVAGRIQSGSGAGIGGVTVRIRAEDGEAAAETSTFSDGEYYLSRLRPGSYVLTVAPSSLAALGGVPEPDSLAFTIGTRGADLVELPPVVLRLTDDSAAVRAEPPPVVDPLPAPAPARELLASAYFGHDQSVLTSSARRALDELIAHAGQDRSVRLHLIGHASPVGNEEYNLRLSARRVDAVVRYLRRHGFSPDQLSREPLGAQDPVRAADPLERERLSRRVDVWMVRPSPDQPPANPAGEP